MPELDGKIAECDRDLGLIKQQLAKCRTPAQQAPLKQRAMQVLKRKQMYTQQRDGVQTRMFNLEQTQFALDGMAEAKAHVDVMKAGVTQMKDAYKDLDLGEIEDLQEDMVDMLADTEEINEVLGRSYDTYNTVSEADLDSALADLDSELAGAEPVSGLAGATAAGAGSVAAPAGAVAAGGAGGMSSMEAELAALSSVPSVPTGRVDAGGARAAPVGSTVRF